MYGKVNRYNAYTQRLKLDIHSAKANTITNDNYFLVEYSNAKRKEYLCKMIS